MKLLVLDSYIEKLKEFEGLRLTAYRPKGEKPSPYYTIGYGHYGILEPMTITKSEAHDLLLFDVRKCQLELTQLFGERFEEFSLSRTSALIDFVFNLGIRSFSRSTLYKLIIADPSDHRIPREFMRWNRSGKQVLAGLTKRCRYRSNLWLSNSNV